MGRLHLVLLALGLGLPALAVQVASPVPHLDADAVEYFAHLRSLYVDRDLDFANEFAHFGLLTQGDKVAPTENGHQRTIVSVGPALLWMPFYAVADAWARGAGDREDGYSDLHLRAVGLASLFYAVAGVVLLAARLRDHFPPRAVFWTSVLLFYGSFLYWYAAHEAVSSHAPTFFMAALALHVWWPGRRDLRTGRAGALGFVLGVAASLRGPNAVLLLLPAASLLRAAVAAGEGGLGRERAGTLLQRGGLVLAAFLAGLSPQLLAWKAVFGDDLLADPPHGPDFLRLDHPFLLNTFFSSRHGLLYWTPVLWLGFLGLLAFFRRDRFSAGAIALPLLVMSYVNACSGDWWAGDSFSNRRFDSVLPLLAVGLAASLSALREELRRRPLPAVVAIGLAFVLWNQLLVVQYREKKIPADDTVSFAAVSGYNAKLLSRYAGTPLAWPANHVFAAELDLPPARYDLAVGKYLFYRQNNLGGLVKVGDGRADPALFAGDWSPPRPCGDALCREVRGRARVLAALDVPEDLDLTLRAQGGGTLSLAVNGRAAAAFALEETPRGFQARVPRSAWRRELNDVSLRVSAGGHALIESVVFERASGSRPGGALQ